MNFTIDAQRPVNDERLVTITIKGKPYYCAPLPAYTGYFASTCGHIISLVHANSKSARLRKLDWTSPRILKATKNHAGYLCVSIADDLGSSKCVRVNRAIASALLQRPISQEPLARLQVNHLNKNRQDNRACNLAWTTARENATWNQIFIATETERTGEKYD